MPETGTLRDLIADRLEELQGTEEEVDSTFSEDMLQDFEDGELRERLMDMREKNKERRRRLLALLAMFHRQGRGVSDEVAQAIRGSLGNLARMKVKGRARDLAFIWALRRHLHLLIAGYGTLRAQAKALGLREAADELKENLADVTQLDEMMEKLAERHAEMAAAPA
jgi:ferritin-like metal-binding protein YciE